MPTKSSLLTPFVRSQSLVGAVLRVQPVNNRDESVYEVFGDGVFEYQEAVLFELLALVVSESMFEARWVHAPTPSLTLPRGGEDKTTTPVLAGPRRQ